MKKKYGLDRLTTSARMYKKDWGKAAEIASQRGCNLPDAIHELIENGATQAKTQPRNVVTGDVQIPGLVMEGNKIIRTAPKIASTMTAQPQNALPLYNPMVHRPGDRVRVLRGNKLIAVTIPELDADGHPIPN